MQSRCRDHGMVVVVVVVVMGWDKWWENVGMRKSRGNSVMATGVSKLT